MSTEGSVGAKSVRVSGSVLYSEGWSYLFHLFYFLSLVRFGSRFRAPTVFFVLSVFIACHNTRSPSGINEIKFSPGLSRVVCCGWLVLCQPGLQVSDRMPVAALVLCFGPNFSERFNLGSFLICKCKLHPWASSLEELQEVDEKAHFCPCCCSAIRCRGVYEPNRNTLSIALSDKTRNFVMCRVCIN